MKNDQVTSASIRMAAMTLLAMREHTVKELQLKLTRKFDKNDLIDSALSKLTSEGLQSDSRFAEAFINMRLRQGKGALIIDMELKAKGVSDELIGTHLLAHETDMNWGELALKAYQKKFGDKPLVDIKDKAKRVRFLMGRGFSSANIQYVFNYLQ